MNSDFPCCGMLASSATCSITLPSRKMAAVTSPIRAYLVGSTAHDFSPRWRRWAARYGPEVNLRRLQVPPISLQLEAARSDRRDDPGSEHVLTVSDSP